MITKNYYQRLVVPVVMLAMSTGGIAWSQDPTPNNDVVLTIDMSDGSTRIDNTGGVAINIDSYQINSPGGLLDSAGWSTLQSQLPATGWDVPVGGSATSLAELNSTTNPSTPLNLTAATGTQGLGSAFTTSATVLEAAQSAAGFGNAYLDVEFVFGDDDANASFIGAVEYENELANSLVLEINTNTGVMNLFNESRAAVTIDFFQITDPDGTNALSPAGFTGLAGLSRPGWENPGEPVNNVDGLVEFFPGDGTSVGQGDTIAGGEALGNLGAAFNTNSVQRDIELRFHVVGGDDAGILGVVRYVEEGVVGDYNDDGVVNLADYTVWRDNLGTSIALPNEDPSSTPGVVTTEDYDVWKGNFGAGQLVAASVVGASTVPEPASLGLIAVIATIWGLSSYRKSKE